ncbi:hypothetical protein PISMIDRAFT_599886 [Pisolithus microcarpus 441]|uniref:Unplaced genomic scaffold scaffold_870, whole genome shotgun sequence n=1 Tax=Pisolithus microcarpus 441 TaxID=765257 RepID=A0A0C9Y085_9AGAM|nr:hypothetical protein PISMIDRAFT_599886 [Pisolithus microcarpus 441]
MTIGRNVYDVSKVCQGHDLCYAEDEVICRFLDSHSTRTMLGAESPRNFSLCSSTVGRNFVSHLYKWAHRTPRLCRGTPGTRHPDFDLCGHGRLAVQLGCR